MGMRTGIVCVLPVILLAGCRGYVDLGAHLPVPAILNADEYRSEITAIDRLVFEQSQFTETRRAALATGIDQLAARIRKSSTSRFIAIEAFELKALAGRYRRAAPGTFTVALSNEWIRIRSNLFEDCAWFARSAADLEPPQRGMPAQPVTPLSVAPPQPPPAAPAVPDAVARLMEGLKAVRPPYPGLAEVLSIGERLVAHGAAAKPAALPLANWLRFYSDETYEQDPNGLRQRLARIITTLDPEGGYYSDARLRYDRRQSGQDRSRAVMLLRYLSLPGERAVPILRSAMDDPDEWVRDIAAAGLAAYGEPVPPDPRSLTERLLAGSPRVSGQALAEFRALGGPAKSARVGAMLASGEPRDAYAVGVLVYRLKDPRVQATVLDAIDDPATRKGALVAFGYELPLPRDRVTSLITAMGDPRPEVRDEARGILLRKCPNRRELVPMLIAAVASGPPARRETAAAALAEITGRAYGTNAEMWRLWRDAKIDGEPPELLLPGERHGSEVPLNADGPWWAICSAGARRELKRVTVSVSTVFDAMIDQEGQPTGARLEIRGCDAPLALLRNVPRLAARSLPEGTASPVRSGAVDLRFGGKPFAIRQMAQGGSGYRLEYSTGGRAQTLYATDEVSADLPATDLWSVAWIGDLDDDGKPDLLLNATNHYNVSQVSLFLSGAAPPGSLLKLVASFTTVGG